LTNASIYKKIKERSDYKIKRFGGICNEKNPGNKTCHIEYHFQYTQGQGKEQKTLVSVGSTIR